MKNALVKTLTAFATDKEDTILHLSVNSHYFSFNLFFNDKHGNPIHKDIMLHSSQFRDEVFKTINDDLQNYLK